MFAHDSLIKSCALTSNFKHASLYKKNIIKDLHTIIKKGYQKENINIYVHIVF